MRGEEKDKHRFFSPLLKKGAIEKTLNCKGRDILIPRKLAMDIVNISCFLEMFNLLFFHQENPHAFLKIFK